MYEYQFIMYVFIGYCDGEDNNTTVYKILHIHNIQDYLNYLLSIIYYKIIIFYFSGESGSGKTHCALQLLRQLFEETGGGTQADIFKHVSAAMTVLGSLWSAATVANTESTRVVRSLLEGRREMFYI